MVIWGIVCCCFNHDVYNFAWLYMALELKRSGDLWGLENSKRLWRWNDLQPDSFIVAIASFDHTMEGATNNFLVGGPGPPRPEKYERQLGWLETQYMGKYNMFQTTNQNRTPEAPCRHGSFKNRDGRLWHKPQASFSCSLSSAQWLRFCNDFPTISGR